MIDFLVVGGGIAGISAAARLSHLGNVTVIEAEDGLGYHASGRSAAMFEESYGLPSTISLNSASRGYLAAANGGVLSDRGLLLIGDENSRDAFASDLITMKLHPIPVSDALAMVPILNPEIVIEAAHHKDAWDIDTDRLIQNFAREVRENSGNIITGERVEKIVKSDPGWHIITQIGDYKARVLLNAAGAWADQIAVLAGVSPVDFSPCRRSMARIPAPGGHDVSNWPMMFGPGETWYAKPDAGCLIVSPADEDPCEPHDAWPEDLTLAEGLARYEAIVTEPVTRLDSSWAGLRTFSPDRSLVIGPDADDDTFFWVAGQGGYGFQTSPAASQLVADLIAGRPSELNKETVSALSPARFR